METRKSHISSAFTSVGIPKGIETPLRPERFRDVRVAHLSHSLGITQFGVNQVRLAKGVYSSLRHWHEGEDEFVLVLEGKPTLIDNNGETELASGSIVGFPAGEENAHCLTNYYDEAAVLLVIGSRRPGADVCHYPDDPLGPIQR